MSFLFRTVRTNSIAVYFWHNCSISYLILVHGYLSLEQEQFCRVKLWFFSYQEFALFSTVLAFSSNHTLANWIRLSKDPIKRTADFTIKTKLIVFLFANPVSFMENIVFVSPLRTLWWAYAFSLENCPFWQHLLRDRRICLQIFTPEKKTLSVKNAALRNIDKRLENTLSYLLPFDTLKDSNVLRSCEPALFHTLGRLVPLNFHLPRAWNLQAAFD